MGMLFDGMVRKDLFDHIMECHQDGTDYSILLMEECAELIEALARTFRPDRETNIEHVAEEMAHVFMTMEMTAQRLGVTSEMIQEQIDKKRKKHGLI